jgi:hypothetical protein
LILLCGDFNCDENSITIKNLLDSKEIISLRQFLSCSKNLNVKNNNNYSHDDNVNTFHNFTGNGYSQIDHIFIATGS